MKTKLAIMRSPLQKADRIMNALPPDTQRKIRDCHDADAAVQHRLRCGIQACDEPYNDAE